MVIECFWPRLRDVSIARSYAGISEGGVAKATDRDISTVSEDVGSGFNKRGSSTFLASPASAATSITSVLVRIALLLSLANIPSRIDRLVVLSYLVMDVWSSRAAGASSVSDLIAALHTLAGLN